MLNQLNDENTVLQCIAERTFLAKLEGGCSAPIAAHSGVTENSIWIEGAVFDLEGTQRIQDRFEIKFDQDNCPVVINATASISAHKIAEETAITSTPTKRKLDEEESDDTQEELESKQKKVKNINENDEIESKTTECAKSKSYSFIVDLNIREFRMAKAELCGLHLAEKLKSMGADELIKEIKAQIHK